MVDSFGGEVTLGKDSLDEGYLVKSVSIIKGDTSFISSWLSLLISDGDVFGGSSFAYGFAKGSD